MRQLHLHTRNYSDKCHFYPALPDALSTSGDVAGRAARDVAVKGASGGQGASGRGSNVTRIRVIFPFST
jgi:hypothetical protein